MNSFAARMDESWGRCTSTTIPDKILAKLKTFNVNIVGKERPLAIFQIRYGDDAWKILREWAIQSTFEHTVRLLFHPKTAENSVRDVLGNGKAYPIQAQYLQELRSLCKECSDESQNIMNSCGHRAGCQRSLFNFPGEYFYHAKCSWDTIPAKLQSPSAQYPVLSRMPSKSYLCDMLFDYADCGICVSVYKDGELP